MAFDDNFFHEIVNKCFSRVTAKTYIYSVVETKLIHLNPAGRKHLR